MAAKACFHVPFQPGFPLPLKRFQKQGADLIPPKVTALFKRNSFPIEIASQRVYPTQPKDVQQGQILLHAKAVVVSAFLPTPFSHSLNFLSEFHFIPPSTFLPPLLLPRWAGGLYCRRRSNDSILPLSLLRMLNGGEMPRAELFSRKNKRRQGFSLRAS